MSLPEHGLERAVWTETDFDEMGWHDATIRAYSLQKADNDDVPDSGPWTTDRLMLDLDYITRWVERRGAYTFWVAPATLVFSDVSALQVMHSPDLADASSDLEVADLHRAGDEWHVEGHTFDIRFKAEGFRQVFRAVPRHGQGQKLSLSQRGGYSYSEEAADL